MGDARVPNEQVQHCQYPLYGENRNIPAKDDLAKSGFYYVGKDKTVKCTGCGLEMDTLTMPNLVTVNNLHKEKSPTCQYVLPLHRTKKFFSYDSLRFEKERLETFIDWPVEWLNPADLAKDGFYYLRTADHCACVFCRGIVGAWENGDTPRREHLRHFPQCPFIKGQPVGNIPITHSTIISRISPSPEASPALPLSTDVCGVEKLKSGSCSDNNLFKKADLALANLGLPQHTGPKRKEYLSQVSRENTFRSWPDKVKQTPKELAEAGFFYCGLSDHVRCYYCGNGLRNWEKDDDPWVEHARWYPECNYVLVKKGQDFIDKVRREKPPYMRSEPAVKASTSAKVEICTITEQELDRLMELDISKATVAMGFPVDKVRIAVRRKLEQTGAPFFRLESCIEAVLKYMEEETRLAHNQSAARSVESEAAALQSAMMEALQSESQRQQTSSNSNVTNTVSTTSTSSLSSSSSSLSSPSAGPSSQPDPGTFSPEEPMETEPAVSPTDEVLTQADQVIGLAEQALSAAPTSSSSPTPNTSSGSSSDASLTSTPTTPPPSVSSPPQSVSSAPPAAS